MNYRKHLYLSNKFIRTDKFIPEIAEYLPYRIFPDF